MGEFTLLIIKPNFHMDEVIEYVEAAMESNGFVRHLHERRRINKPQAVELYAGLRGKWYAHKPVQFIINGQCYITVWYHPDGNAVALAKKLVGPTYYDQIMREDCIRRTLLQKYGQAQPPFDQAANFVHVPGDDEEHRQQLEAVLGRKLPKSWYNPAA